MTTRNLRLRAGFVAAKAPAAKAPAAKAPAKAKPVKYDRSKYIARLAIADAAERALLLSALPVGEIAAIVGTGARIGTSANEALATKMTERHGAGWPALANAKLADLTDQEKAGRKAIDADLNNIRDTIKSAGGQTPEASAKARDVIRRVKEWSLGTRKSKSEPKANAKQATDDWLLSWPVLPSMYRRISNDENCSDAADALRDAICAYLGTNMARHILSVSGPSDYKPTVPSTPAKPQRKPRGKK